jgi:chaperonin cofactor prefoldin
LPADNVPLLNLVTDNDVALVIFDPLVSQLDGKLDTHKDSEIRQGLEPLKVIAETTGCFMIGLIHFNKGQSKNVLDRIMGSKAFTAVARSVHAVLPDDQQPKGHGYLMTVKNNLGKSGLPLLQYHIESAQVEIEDRQEDDDMYSSVGVVVWDEESHESAEEVYDRIYNPKPVHILSGNKDERADELSGVIRKLVEDNGGEMEVDKIMLSLIQDAMIEDNAAGHKRAQRARKSAGLQSKKATGERYTGWLWFINRAEESI